HQGEVVLGTRLGGADEGEEIPDVAAGVGVDEVQGSVVEPADGDVGGPPGAPAEADGKRSGDGGAEGQRPGGQLAEEHPGGERGGQHDVDHQPGGFVGDRRVEEELAGGPDCAEEAEWFAAPDG